MPLVLAIGSVGESQNIEQLMEITAAIASERNGDIVALRITLISEQTSPGD